MGLELKPEAKNLSPEQIAQAVSPEVVTVNVPINVLWDFDALTSIKKDVLGRLGCMACTSGFDIRWKGAREFVVNPALEVSEMVR
jgi:hypothetical protein